MAKVSKITRVRKKSSPRAIRIAQSELIPEVSVGRAERDAEPVVISRPYLAPLGADNKRIARIGSAAKQVINERPRAKAK